jgi:hypothetical protein
VVKPRRREDTKTFLAASAASNGRLQTTAVPETSKFHFVPSCLCTNAYCLSLPSIKMLCAFVAIKFVVPWCLRGNKSFVPLYQQTFFVPSCLRGIKILLPLYQQNFFVPSCLRGNKILCAFIQ